MVELATSSTELVKGNGSSSKPFPLSGQLTNNPKSFIWNHLLGPGACWKITYQTGPLFQGRTSQVALFDTGIRPSFRGRGLGQFVYPVGSQQQTMTNQYGNRVPFGDAFDHPTVCPTAAIFELKGRGPGANIRNSRRPPLR